MKKIILNKIVLFFIIANCFLLSVCENHWIIKITDPLFNHQLNVYGGKGSGVYYQGTEVTITANTPPAGQQFLYWTTDKGGTFADSTADTTTFTMPKNDVTVTANFGDPSKVLDHITADYTVTDTIYTTTTLAALKTDLTVTAYYSDGSDEVLSDTAYTLTGTLTVGTSTITVTYNGKTCTFTVTVELPPAGTYTVTLETATGGSITANKTTAVYQNETITITITTDTNYNFKELTSVPTVTFSGSGNTRTFTMPSQDITITPVFELITFTVTFDNEGTTHHTINNVTNGSTITAPTSPTKTDYIFQGWYKESTLTTKWNFATDTVTSATTLYARWSHIETGPYRAGDTGPGGGIIFYVEPNPAGFALQGFVNQSGTPYMAKYLEAAPDNISSYWSTTGTLITGITTFTSDTDPLLSMIGNGRKDTMLIVAHLAANTTETGRAAQLAVTPQGGKDDWFLPSIGELFLYAQTDPSITGRPIQANIWSSSQVNTNSVWRIAFSTCTVGTYNKSGTHQVRPIRAFGDGPAFADGSNSALPIQITQSNWQTVFADMRTTAGLTKHYKLTDDITVGTWEPIGNASSSFTGTFDGGGHTITGLSISGSISNKGLFYTLFGEVRNLGLNVNISTTVSGNLGGIAGGNHGTIENCFVTGTINSSGVTTTQIGGIVGWNNTDGTIKNCYSITTINNNSTGNGNYIGSGGIVGVNTSNIPIQNCVALGSQVSSTAANTAGRVIGRFNQGVAPTNPPVGTGSSNYANAGMGGSTGQFTAKTASGKDITATQWEDPDWWENTHCQQIKDSSFLRSFSTI